MTVRPIEIGQFNTGGLADSKFSGSKNSLYKMIGWDPHSTPGVLNVAQKLTKDSGTTIDEFCKCAVNCSNGIRYWFSSTSGKIWQDKAGVWTLVYTTSPAAGTAYCLGAEEYQGYLYWATQSRLHRIPVASADGDTAWTANAVPNWATFGVTDTDFHPMLNHSGQQILYIGDGNHLAQVDAGVFSANALDIVTPLRIKSLGKFKTDILLGTYVSDTYTQTPIIRWNCFSVSFTSTDDIPEIGINAFFPADNSVYVHAGTAGNIYYYDGDQLSLFKTIPGDYSPTATATVHPNAVANYGGQILFGVSNVSGDPCTQLVYRLGRHSSNYRYILDQPYPISERSGGEFVLSGIEIGAILVSGSDVYVSWKNGSTKGVDKLDWSTKLDGAYFETRVATVLREQQANLSMVVADYASLPASTGLSFYIDKNYAGYGSALNTITDTDRNLVFTKNEATQFNTIQLKVKATTSANTAPQLESCLINLS